MAKSKLRNTINAGGGKLIGRGKGKRAQNDGRKGGYAVGDRHSDPSGGISAKVGTDGNPIKFEGREAVITAPAMDDERPIHEFDGVKGLTKRQVASRINVLGGGVDFAEKGMIVPKKIKCTGKFYKYGGSMVIDYEIIKDCGCKHSNKKMAEGGNIGNQLETQSDNELGNKYESIQLLSAIEISDVEVHIKDIETIYKTLPDAVNSNDQMHLRFVNSVFGKIIRDRYQNVVLHTIPYLPTIINTAIPIYVELTNKKYRSSILSYHNYLNKISFDEKEYFIRITAHEKAPSKKVKNQHRELHSLFISDIQIEKAADATVNFQDHFSLATSGQPQPLIDTKLQNWLKRAKEASLKLSQQGKMQLGGETQHNLLKDISKLDLAEGYKMYEGHPQEFLNYIQEQATGMMSDRKSVNTLYAGYNRMTEMFGKDITIRSVEQIPAEEKAIILKAWKGKTLDPELRKALRVKTMQNGGEIKKREKWRELNIQINSQLTRAGVLNSKGKIIKPLDEFPASEWKDWIKQLIKQRDELDNEESKMSDGGSIGKPDQMASGGEIDSNPLEHTLKNQEIFSKLESDMEKINQQIAQQNKRMEESVLFALMGSRYVIAEYYNKKPGIKHLLTMILGYEKDIKDYHSQLTGIATEHADNAQRLSHEINSHKHSFLSRNPSYPIDEYENADDEKLCSDAKKYADIIKTISGKEVELWGGVSELRILIINDLEYFVRVCQELKSAKENILSSLGYNIDDLNITGSNYREIMENIKRRVKQLENEKLELLRRADVLASTGIEIGTIVPPGTEERLASMN